MESGAILKNPMGDDWDADIEVGEGPAGGFPAVLVLTPPAEIGPSIRLPIEGVCDRPELAELAALDAFAAMTRGT